MEIVVLDGYTENPGDLSWEGLEQLGDLTVYDRSSQDQIVERIGNAEIVLVNKVQLTKEIMAHTTNLKYIGVLATGYNVVDVEAAKAKGITVTNIPTYGTDGVAQYAIALLLELCHRIGEHSTTVFAGDWTTNADWCYWNSPQMELAGKTIGIIGYGRIGQKVGAIAAALGMTVIANDRSHTEGIVAGAKMVDLDQLFSESDVISLHCPLFPETEGLINKETIAKMKDGVYIVNDSRGQLINEADLRDALNSGKVGGAAVDVVSTEPIKQDNPLLEAKNMIITPHMAWASREARARLMAIAVENVEKFQAGTPVNVVN
ncbi:D-2-hydroxyacid dehydrogenase (plasmid) [Enterococcus gilvus]|jgi:glycerate dehydrogenase|uniref:D-2-hydroxyacid dehydrogenase n=1 Tax=Enterococcus gilvus TaxID=160453 RepID=UPI000DF5EBEE|nr:D-2-hydroxyacid dehydrogenase [Enterococcus gilvus]AXG40573.1 D-2-hydroxyacid dehydrogenase [Enterococcus gilvus]